MSAFTYGDMYLISKEENETFVWLFGNAIFHYFSIAGLYQE